ncbi:PREDICTED: transcription initiation factor IIB-like [Amphimedon queenslandica]|uniref:Transcription initiation factor IIB n=1 Tax=Amphimedon queenslandica TaxID=400682 RepID=A0A1X7USP6_AMPQE|nr:PREDICTED: transcription initiation factor IIB-like [Amphimedon queenslandica]|eukprot:XP_003386928.1 PREDICTED: transcription initiation factor IIB-like [Amphimedon queenslandica]
MAEGTSSMKSRSGGGSVFNLRCNDHPDAHLIEDYHAGDMVCPECGLVVGDRVIDVGSEWRTFSNERNATDRSRVGAAENPLLDGHELSSFIAPVTGRPGTNDSGKSFPKFSKSGVSAGDKSLMTAFKEIANMADRLNLPRSIVDRGNALFKQVNDEKTLKGRANDAVAAACLYIACRQEDVPRSFKEICAVSRHSKKEIGRCFKLIRQAANPAMNTVSTTDFMSRYCTNLGLPLPVQKAASFIAQKAVELDLAPGRVYLSVAAASIYMASQASDIKKTQKEVGDVVGVADSTIRQSYRLLYPSRHKLFPTDFSFDTPLDELPKH